MTARLPRISECRRCADPIRFVKLSTGSTIPVNPKPGDTGNVVAHLAGGRLIGYVISAEKPASASFPLRFVPHYATCPAEQSRKKAAEPAAVVPDPSLF